MDVMNFRRLLFLCSVTLLGLGKFSATAAGPVINEFMAINHGAFNDQNGDSSDWLEIFNPGTASVNLEGWYLTNDPLNPAQWRFPRVTLSANSFLVVFASGKNRAISGAQ